MESSTAHLPAFPRMALMPPPAALATLPLEVLCEHSQQTPPQGIAFNVCSRLSVLPPWLALPLHLTLLSLPGAFPEHHV